MTRQTAQPSEPAKPSGPDPVVIELGRRSRKQIRKLRRGQGRTWRDIEGVVHDLREAGDVADDAQVVVVVVKERPEESDDWAACWWR